MSTDTRPNILLIMPDQMRGDCLSLAGHPSVLTPNIDEIGGQGMFFRRAYTTAASCIPARRAMVTGRHPSTNGMVGFYGGCDIREPVFPEMLVEAGYETALIGRNMHLPNPDRDYGFQTRHYGSCYIDDDALAQAVEAGAPGAGGLKAAGLSWNGYTARPFHLPEHLHPTTWVANQTRDYLADYDGEKPLFLCSSYYAPHPPLFPPTFYMDRYLRMDLPDAPIGDWATPPENDGPGLGVDSHYVNLTGELLRSAQAGYFGLINHLDDQIYWLLRTFMSAGRGRPWIVIFASDHGEMLGDHHMFRKCEPYEGSSHIPLLIWGSGQLGFKGGQVTDQPVCLEDLMPTLLELAGIDCPEGVDGRSLVPLLRGEDVTVREVLHCEHSTCYSRKQAYHFLTDGRWKYIWHSHEGTERLFNLQTDPKELTDLSQKDPEQTATWRARLIQQLTDRPEGFVEQGKLVAGRDYNKPIPPAADA